MTFAGKAGRFGAQAGRGSAVRHSTIPYISDRFEGVAPKRCAEMPRALCGKGVFVRRAVFALHDGAEQYIVNRYPALCKVLTQNIPSRRRRICKAQTLYPLPAAGGGAKPKHPISPASGGRICKDVPPTAI